MFNSLKTIVLECRVHYRSECYSECNPECYSECYSECRSECYSECRSECYSECRSECHPEYRSECRHGMISLYIIMVDEFVRPSVTKNFLEIEFNPADLIENVICINEIGFIFF